jgi:hypothetical protein
LAYAFVNLVPGGNGVKPSTASLLSTTGVGLIFDRSRARPSVGGTQSSVLDKIALGDLRVAPNNARATGSAASVNCILKLAE